MRHITNRCLISIMTKNDIDKIISKKGRCVKDSYYSLCINVMSQLEDCDKDYLEENNIDEDLISIVSYNITILFMSVILDNSTFFEEEFGINERNRNRIRKDLKTMNHIKYPEKYDFLDLYDYEVRCVDDLTPKKIYFF